MTKARPPSFVRSQPARTPRIMAARTCMGSVVRRGSQFRKNHSMMKINAARCSPWTTAIPVTGTQTEPKPNTTAANVHKQRNNLEVPGEGEACSMIALISCPLNC
ncbi:MAG: hypothetical protein BWY09_02477 [Candidatus Hydrogenedentes bacterium ADurb.Bin179]|nr:MAG: hypothetical protein BWY09_02477 [Candidatus Hydrogenedentes bacterium ADurb.Bin179]